MRHGLTLQPTRTCEEAPGWVFFLAMLSFDIRSLTEHAVVVDDVLSPNDPVWEESDSRPSAPVRVRGRLSPAGPGRFYWHGSIEGDVALECSRCLGDASAHVTDDTLLIFAEPGSDVVVDDPDVFLLDEGSDDLDLRPALREQWLLNVPGYALCREDCKGLCPTCGAELNLGPCDCASTAADSRWDALRKLQREQG